MPAPPNITFYDVGQDIRDNIAVESLDYTKLMVGVGQKLQIRGNLRNYGDVPYPDLRVYFKVDGKEKAISQVNLGPQQHTQVLFTHAFDTTGSHVVEIYAEGDSLKADNSALAELHRARQAAGAAGRWRPQPRAAEERDRLCRDRAAAVRRRRARASPISSPRRSSGPRR